MTFSLGLQQRLTLLGEDYGDYTQMCFCVQTARHSASDGTEQNTGDSMPRPRRHPSEVYVHRLTVKKIKNSANGTQLPRLSSADYVSNTQAVNAHP